MIVSPASLPNRLNSRLVPRLGMERLMRIGSGLAALAGLLAGIAGFTGIGGLAGFVLTMVMFSAMNGLIVANSLASALEAFPDRAGAASALVGAIQYGSGILGSALVGLLADGTPAPLGLVMALMGAGCLLCAQLLPRKVQDTAT